LDAITYVVWKKCPAALEGLYGIAIRVWKECSTADDWAQAFMALLKKGDLLADLDVVSEFRPITMTATAGKIFLSILADRLQHYMVKNSFIPRSMQKGFLSGVAGCVEHTFVLNEAMKEAKEHTRQIVVSWLDLANAYGSVRHNLIQFALDWYHVPRMIQKLVFDYYEKLMAKVVTKEWSTGFFLFDIGLFQGCVLSAILFLCVFQLLLDMLLPLEEKDGYKFKMTNVKSLAEAYADDLALITRNSAANQRACDRTQRWLEWTETMKAKPAKCVSLGLKQFDSRIKHEAFEPVLDQSYSPFDPKLSIAGKPMHFILDKSNPAFKGSHFKFLGRWIHYYLNEADMKKRIQRIFTEDVTRVDRSLVNGYMKLWLYQFYILSHLSWPFVVHDLDLSFSRDLQAQIQPLLKRWAGVGRSVDIGVLFRPRADFGLALTSISDHYTSMQLVKCQLLESSVDKKVRDVYASRCIREAKLRRVWRATNLNRKVNAQVDLDLRFPAQLGRQGLGAGNYNANPTKPERRKLASITAKSFSRDKHMQHAQSLARQGVWLQWHDQTVPVDLSWKNLIYGPGPHVIKFVLNATVNWVKTPDLLQLWGYKQRAQCVLCGCDLCTLHHILVGCKTALKSKRYNWRHDSVLQRVAYELRPLVEEANARPTKPRTTPHISSSFVLPGAEPKATKKSHRSSSLDGASDWKVLVDYDHESIVFPPEICATSKRPDLIIWSAEAKRVLLIELTCPAEEGILAAQVYKESRYSELLEHINGSTSWTATLLTIEVGARGYVGRTVPRCFKKLGLCSSSISLLCKNLGEISARCSYAIYLASESLAWDKARVLLALD
jgi:hypothetical protein